MQKTVESLVVTKGQYDYCFTDLFIDKGLLRFANKIKSICQIDLICSGILFSISECSPDNDIQRNRQGLLILVIEKKRYIMVEKVHSLSNSDTVILRHQTITL